MMDRPHLDVDSLEAAEGALSIREVFVGADGCRRVKYILREVRSAQTPARAASASICAALRVNVRSSSVMVTVKCLAAL